MDENFLRKTMSAGILILLVVLTFFILKPILIPLFLAFLLAFVFAPVYKLFCKIFYSKNFSAILIVILLIVLILLPVWFLTPIVTDQSFKIYLAAQEIDFIAPLKKIFPSLFASDEFSAEVGSILHSFVIRTINSLLTELSNIVFNFPTLILQFSVVLFTFFFVLRDKEKLLKYIKSLLPFPKKIEKKLFESSKDITISVLYGQVIVGLVQGLILSIGLFIFKVPNSLLLSLLAMLAGIFPIIGTALVWVPVVVYLILAGNAIPSIGITFFGAISSTVDNFLRPFIVSKKTNMHPSLILIGMIGGIFLFGVLGFILGPLILAYLLIVLELYRDKNN